MNYYDILLAKKLSGGGGGEATLIDKSISSNGTYNASSDNADGYKKVVVNVPNPSTGSLSITSNNTYDVTNYASAVVNVPTGITPTGTVNITQNGTVDVTNYASANVNVSGGGSSPITLLNTITVSEDVRGVSVDLSQYSSYDMLLVFEDITVSSSDYLYYVSNSTDPSGGTYSVSASVNHKGWCGYVFNMPPSNTTRRAGKLNNTNFGVINSMNNLYIYTYTASKTIKTNSKIKIYGGNYADM